MCLFVDKGMIDMNLVIWIDLLDKNKAIYENKENWRFNKIFKIKILHKIPVIQGDPENEEHESLFCCLNLFKNYCGYGHGYLSNIVLQVSDRNSWLYVIFNGISSIWWHLLMELRMFCNIEYPVLSF